MGGRKGVIGGSGVDIIARSVIRLGRLMHEERYDDAAAFLNQVGGQDPTVPVKMATAMLCGIADYMRVTPSQAAEVLPPLPSGGEISELGKLCDAQDGIAIYEWWAATDAESLTELLCGLAAVIVGLFKAEGGNMDQGCDNPECPYHGQQKLN